MPVCVLCDKDVVEACRMEDAGWALANCPDYPNKERRSTRKAAVDPPSGGSAVKPSVEQEFYQAGTILFRTLTKLANQFMDDMKKGDN
jgi:hypothetical protein